jgi:alkylhydroperoxidase/carboxymuconolactone decarboxylase family protein YurZ
MADDNRIAEAIARLAAESGDNPLADHPQLQQFVICYLETFLYKGTIDPRLREQAILRIMWRLDQPYEWGNHYRWAKKVGLTDEEVLGVRSTTPERDLDSTVALVIRAADEIVDRGCLSPETMTSVEQLFVEPGQIMEFLYLITGYRMMASVSASRGHRKVKGQIWPPDGVGPSGAGDL